MTAAIGKAVPLLNTLTNAVETAPKPNCIAPIKAEAVPAFSEKGARQSAEEFGKANPCVLKNIQIKNIVEYKKASCKSIYGVRNRCTPCP